MNYAFTLNIELTGIDRATWDAVRSSAEFRHMKIAGILTSVCAEWLDKRGVEVTIQQTDSSALDVLSRFINAKCATGAKRRIATAALYEAYAQFCGSLEKRPLYLREFAPVLEEIGFRRGRSAKTRWTLGLDLATQ